MMVDVTSIDKRLVRRIGAKALGARNNQNDPLDADSRQDASSFRRFRAASLKCSRTCDMTKVR